MAAPQLRKVRTAATLRMATRPGKGSVSGPGVADENGFDDVNGKAEVEEHTLENGETDEDEKEYEALDQELDQINSCLDKLENWNDSLQSRMKDMLETMQKARVERQPQINGKSSDSDTQRPQDAN